MLASLGGKEREKPIKVFRVGMEGGYFHFRRGFGPPFWANIYVGVQFGSDHAEIYIQLSIKDK